MEYDSLIPNVFYYFLILSNCFHIEFAFTIPVNVKTIDKKRKRKSP